MKLNIPTISEKGWFVEFGKGKQRKGSPEHLFCGPHDIDGARCPNCEKNLLRFLTLDLTDRRFSGYGINVPVVHLLNCWTCNLAQNPFIYQMQPSGGIEIIKYGRGGQATDFPYGDYPEYFPAIPPKFRQVNPRAQKALTKVNADYSMDYEFTLPQNLQDLLVPMHQIGGEPYLVQKELRNLSCPACSKPLVFFANLGDKAGDPRGFVDNDYVQMIFLVCKHCAILASYQQCD